MYKNQRSLFQWSYVISVLIFIFLISQCKTAEAQDAQHARLVSYEKQKHSTYFIVTVRGADSCSEYVARFNSHCWRCTDVEIPKVWDVVKTRQGKFFIKPVL